MNMEKIIENIDFSMGMEEMPLTDADKNRLRGCLSGKDDIYKIIQETVKKHTRVKV